MSNGFDRRQVLALGAIAAGGVAAPAIALPASQRLSLEIAPVTVDLAPGISIRTTGYNGSVPGPVLRLREGEPVEIAVRNATGAADTVYWHGLEGSAGGAFVAGPPPIQPGEENTYRFTPLSAGTFWYHAHVSAKADLSRGGYSGQSGFLLVEQNRQAGGHEREVLLAAQHWGPELALPNHFGSHAKLHYEHASFNGKKLGAGDPIQVRSGERVLFRILNASATEDITLALPGHRFTVTALDGAPVPNPRSVEVLSLAVGERVDALVEMNHPGKWVLGSIKDGERTKGLGVVVEYEHATGQPIWRAPSNLDWEYAHFAGAGSEPSEPEDVFAMWFERRVGSDGIGSWLINGDDHLPLPMPKVRRGGKYRFRWINLSGDALPLHLQRHRFHLTRVNQTPVRGLMKDTVSLPPYGVIEAEFIADGPGPALLHSPNQFHMDHGFKSLIEYI